MKIGCKVTSDVYIKTTFDSITSLLKDSTMASGSKEETTSEVLKQGEEVELIVSYQ